MKTPYPRPNGPSTTSNNNTVPNEQRDGVSETQSNGVSETQSFKGNRASKDSHDSEEKLRRFVRIRSVQEAAQEIQSKLYHYLNSASLDKPRELHDKCNVVTPKQLANLRRPPKGERPRRKDGSLAVSPGRPATRWLVEMIRADYAKNPAKIVALLRKRKIEVYCAYGFGKPVETVQLGGIPGQPLQVEDISSLTIPELQARLAAIKAKEGA